MALVRPKYLDYFSINVSNQFILTNVKLILVTFKHRLINFSPSNDIYSKIF